MKSLIYTITAVLFLVNYSLACAQNFSSNNKQVNLIELYTSEGCSSCPPADDWLNQLKHDPRLWSEFIPVAFHVDYWDYIGWKDSFARPQFGHRQRQYSQQKKLSSVYTPGMLLNGQEWTSWRGRSKPDYTIDKAAGNLTINLSDRSISASYRPLEKSQSTLILNIAVLGFDLKVDIRRGENSGRTLTHDFVVVGYKQVTMDLSHDGVYTVSTDTLLPYLVANPSTKALVAWVNNENNLSPIQTTGGWIK